MSDLLNGSGGVPADHPFLAFVNSVSDDGKSRTENLFDNGIELLGLLLQSGFDRGIDVPQAPEMGHLIAFRESAYGVLSASASKRVPPPDDVARVETIMKKALTRSRFRFCEAGLSTLPGSQGGLVDVLALELLDLTTSEEFGRLSECRRCSRLFIDRGRGRGRRWCDMARCGNRAKAESFRARRKASKLAS